MLGLFGGDLDHRLADLGLPSEMRQGIAEQREDLAALEIPASLGEPQRTRVRSAVDEAFLRGFRGVMLTAAALALLASLSAAWLIRAECKPGNRSVQT